MIPGLTPPGSTPGEVALVALYVSILGVLSIYGIHRCHLVLLRRRVGRRAPRTPSPPGRWPPVTVQLPLYNERLVVERLLEAVGRIDYPRDRLEVQVLDDSDDATRDLAAATVRRLRRRGIDVVHLHRRRRHGFKAGALAAGLRRARGELVCVFDADFVPDPGILKRMVPHFRDPDVGMVQVRWAHLNRDYSTFTRIQAMLLDAHFSIEHAARSWSGRFFNFNGTAGIWRRQTIEDAGGWQHDTLTEDLDLSYRAQLRGWRFVYLDDDPVPAELPVTMGAFKSQQHRWTKGAVQTARKLLRRIWDSDVSLSVKLEATFHLTANVAYPLMVLVSLLLVPAMEVRMRDGLRYALALDVPVLAFATGSVCAFYLEAARRVGDSTADAARRLPALMALGIGISLNNAVAVLQGFRQEPGEFVRTPKYSVTDDSDRPVAAVGDSGRRWLPWLETALGVVFTLAVGFAVAEGLWPALPFLVLFQAGFLYVGGRSLLESSGPVARLQTSESPEAA